MKVILSRKGFDNANGVIASPIMPDGSMISFPIPSTDKDSFDDICFENKSYMQILHDLKPSKEYNHCHIDPDLINRRSANIKDWKPAFGQINQAEKYLEQTVGVEKGDVILFFGTFHKVIEKNGKYMFSKRTGDFYSDNDLHVIWGYMQIGEILKDKQEISEYYWHPHADERRIDNSTNALYVPAEKLSWNKEQSGYGVFNYDEKRVLTLKDHTKANWKYNAVYSPDFVIGNRKNSAKNEGIYYSGIWQELGLQESDKCVEWAKNMIGED